MYIFGKSPRGAPNDRGCVSSHAENREALQTYIREYLCHTKSEFPVLPTN